MADLRKALIRLAHKNPEAREVVLPILKEAKKWQDAALKELAEEAGLWDEDDAEGEAFDADEHFRIRKSPFGHGLMVDAGRMEWYLFEDWDDAEKECLEYLEQTLEDEPYIFNQDWLKGYITISSTDARLIAVEDADSYVEDIKSESYGSYDVPRVVEEAGMESKWEELSDEADELESRRDEIDEEIEALEDQILDAEGAEEKRLEAQKAELEKESEAAVKRIDAIEKEKEDLIDEAADDLSSSMADRTESEIKSDPLGWYEDRYGRIDMEKLPNFMHLDIPEAAEAAMRADGVAHFLASYDGDSVELRDSGAVAFRHN